MRSCLMFQAIFKCIGAIILIGVGIYWLKFGYSSWHIFLLLLGYLAYSTGDRRMKKLTIVKQIPFRSILLLIFAFVLSFAIVFGLIQLSNYLINDIFQLTGMAKTIMIYLAIILSVYPVKFTFGSIVYKVMEDGK